MARTFKLTSPSMHGQDVRAFQRALNHRYDEWVIRKRIPVDGGYGPHTREAAKEVCRGLGIAHSKLAGGITPALRAKIRHPHLRTPAERARARRRRPWLAALRRRYQGKGPAAAIAYARKWVGTTEHPAGSNRGSPEPDDWERRCGFQGAPWCGCFVNACLMAAGFATEPWLAYTPSIEGRAKAHDGGWTWHGPGSAEPGDLIVYGAGIAHHVGLYVKDGVTIEGNTSSGGGGSQDNGGGVFMRHRDFNAPGFPARGVARPPWKGGSR